MIRSPLISRLRSEHDVILRTVEERIIHGMPQMAALPESSKRLWMKGARSATESGLLRWSGKNLPHDHDHEIYIALAQDAVTNGLSPETILCALETGCSVLIAGYWSLAQTGDYSNLAAYTSWKHSQTESAVHILRTAYHDSVRQAGRGELARRAFTDSLLQGDPCPDLARTADLRIAEAYLVVMLPTEALQKDLFPADALLHALDSAQTIVLLPSDGSPDGWADCEARAARGADASGAAHAVALARAAHPADVPGAVAMARRSMALSTTLRLSGVVRPETLRVERLLLQDPELRGDLLATLSPLAGQIDLIATLEQLYRTDLDRGRCASRLGIHRRTLAYRLEKVATLTGIDPLSGPGIKTFQLALAAYSLDTSGCPELDSVPEPAPAPRLSVVTPRSA